MPDYTQNYNLILPKKGENYNVEVANTNNNEIDGILANKMDKKPGKDLSTNDFTDGYKNKIDRILEIGKGDSAYQVAVNNGYEGTEQEWLNSIKGEKGDTGDVSITQLNKIIKIMQQLETPSPTTGENVTLDDCKAGKFKSFGLRGNSEQGTRSGKNYFNPEKLTNKTNNSITITTDESGVPILNGTTTVQTDASSLHMEIPEEITNFTVSGANSNKQISVKVYIYDADKNYLCGVTDTTGNGNTVAVPANAKYYAYAIRVEAGVTLTNEKVYAQLESGITKTSFEAYGVSPSSKFEAPIKSCGDNINLFDKDNLEKQQGYAYSDAGTYVASTNYITFRYIPVSPNTEYSYFDNLSNSKYTSIRVVEFTSAKAFILRSSAIERGNMTFKTSANCKYIAICVYTSGTALLTDFSYAKLEKGKVSSPFSKFGQGNINVTVSNKNLANIEDFNVSSGNNGKTYGKEISGLQENKEYTLSFTKTRISGVTIEGPTVYAYSKILYYNSNIMLKEETGSALLSNFTTGSRDVSIKRQMPSKCNKIIVCFDNYNGDYNINTKVSNVQLEESETKTAFISCKEQIKTIPTQKPFRSIEDTFIKEGGKRYEYHTIKRVILDGTESYTIANNLDGWIQFRHDSINAIKENTELMCNYFNYKEFNITYNRQYEAVTIDKQNRFRISFKDNTEITTVEQLKTWLAQKYAEGHPMYIDYVLAEPELIECTEEQNAVLSDIEDNLSIYDDVTHIYSTDEVAPNMSVTYCKDVEKLFNNITV